MKDFLTIGEVSKLTQLPISTLRYYDNEGILSPEFKDENTNYRYYRFFQIPAIKMIKHLKALGFNNSYIKSHLDNLNYSHTLELMNEVVIHTENEIERLKLVKKELEENVDFITNLINIEKNKNKFSIKKEKIKGIYTKISKNGGLNSISKAFEELDFYISSKEPNFFQIGSWALTISKESVEARTYEFDKMLVLKEFKEFKNKFSCKTQQYVTLNCQGKFDNIYKNVEKLTKWIKDKNFILGGDIIVHVLSGPSFEKNPNIIMYILKAPILSTKSI